MDSRERESLEKLGFIVNEPEPGTHYVMVLGERMQKGMREYLEGKRYMRASKGGKPKPREAGESVE